MKGLRYRRRLFSHQHTLSSCSLSQGKGKFVRGYKIRCQPLLLLQISSPCSQHTLAGSRARAKMKQGQQQQFDVVESSLICCCCLDPARQIIHPSSNHQICCCSFLGSVSFGQMRPSSSQLAVWGTNKCYVSEKVCLSHRVIPTNRKIGKPLENALKN